MTPTKMPGGESIRGRRAVLLARIQNHGREFRLVRRIGKVLRFQAECGAARVGQAALAAGRAIEKVSRVKLHAWLCGPDFQNAACVWFHDASGKRNRSARGAAQNKVVVVTVAQL